MPFKNAGYFVAGAGKIYHSNTYYPGEFDEYFEKRDPDEGDPAAKGITRAEGFHTPVTHDIQDKDLADWHVVNYCIKQLEAKRDRPFFIACGLFRPHLPWVVPRKYYDLFPLETINLPPFKENDLDDLPPAAKRMVKLNDHQKIIESDRWKAAIQSYLASIAYTDMNIGRLLDALEKSPHRDNTIVVLWSDHGWHLGEKSHWRKFALWEEATRMPLIWVVPGVTKPGGICERTVDLMSVYPTLCALAGIPVPAHVEGENIKPLLANPKASWNTPAVTTFGFQNHAVRTEQWRYIRYADGSEELYDHSKDPYEWTNLAGSKDTRKNRSEQAKWLPAKNASEKNAPARTAGGGVGDPRGNGKKPTDLKRK